jgi:hypothetical protein
VIGVCVCVEYSRDIGVLPDCQDVGNTAYYLLLSSYTAELDSVKVCEERHTSVKH